MQGHLGDAHPLRLTLATQRSAGVLSTDQGGQRGWTLGTLHSDPFGDRRWAFADIESGHGGTFLACDGRQPLLDR
jgi:hypothetical protein